MAFSQTNFSDGFKAGYKKGYCQDKGVGCIEPIAPIPPIPQIGEDSNSYQDGYNRGFKIGMSSSTNNETTNRRTFQTTPTQFTENFIYNPYKNSNLLDLKINAVKQLLDNAIESSQNGNYDQSIDYTNRVLKIQPELSIAYLIQSSAYYHSDRLISAYNNGAKAYMLNKTSENKNWFDKLSDEVNTRLGSLMKESAFSTIQQICENVWYKNDMTNYYLALSLYYQNDLKNAKKVFKRVNNFEPAKEFLLAIDNKQSIPNPFLRKSSTNNITSNPQQINLNEISDKVQQYYNSKDYDKVLSILEPLEKSIGLGKINDKNVIWWVYSTKAYCNFKLKIWSKAIADASTAINNSEKNEIATLYFMRAMSKAELKDYYGANSDFDYLIDNYSKLNYKENSLATLLNNKAYNLVLLKDYKSAKSIVDKAISLDNKIDYIWDTKGELEFYLGNYNESVRAMTNSLNITPRGNSFLYRGISYLKLGNKIEACKDLSKAGEMGEDKAYEFIKSSCN